MATSLIAHRLSDVVLEEDAVMPIEKVHPVEANVAQCMVAERRWIR